MGLSPCALPSVPEKRVRGLPPHQVYSLSTNTEGDALSVPLLSVALLMVDRFYFFFAAAFFTAFFAGAFFAAFFAAFFVAILPILPFDGLHRCLQ